MKEANKRGGRYLSRVTKNCRDANREHTARYINHACRSPMQRLNTTPQKTAYSFAHFCKIKEGEEITYDYGKEYLEDLIGKKNCCAATGVGRKRGRRK